MTKCKHTNELLKHTQENREKPNSARQNDLKTLRQTDLLLITVQNLHMEVSSSTKVLVKKE